MNTCKIILLSLFTFSCSSSLKKPIFYEVSKNNQSFYVLGTIHLGVPLTELPKVVTDKFHEAKTFGFELDSKSPTNLAHNTVSFITELTDVLSAVGKTGANPSKDQNREIQNPRFTHESWYFMVQDFKAPFNQYPAAAKNISPKTAFLYLTHAYPKTAVISEKWSRRIDPKNSMDLNMIAVSQTEKKVSFELDDRNIFPVDCEDRFYNELIVQYNKKTGDQMMDEVEEIIYAYRAGDEDRLKKLIKFKDPEVHKCVIHDRNKAWYSKIDRLMKTKNDKNTTFIAVGAGHLIGEFNLLEMFKENGYSVRKVTEK